MFLIIIFLLLILFLLLSYSNLGNFFNDEIIGIRLADKVNLLVAEAPPNIKGNTATGGNKVVVLETGLKVTTPLFINAGDTIRVNTSTGTYSERV